MRLSRAKSRRAVGWDMTPMIDVVLQLVIFFMYTAQFTHMVRTPIDLPREQGEELEETGPTSIIVDVRHDGQLIVDGDPVALDRLIGMIQVEVKKAAGDPSAVDLLVRADQTCPSAHINAIAARLAAIGVRSWKLGTTLPPQNGAGGGGRGGA